MVLHYITLFRQANLLRDKCTPGFVRASFTQRKNELTLHIEPRAGELIEMVLSADANYPFILSRPVQKRSPRSTDILRELIGNQIKDIVMWPTDRVMEFSFANWASKLYLQVFRHRTNFFLVDSTGLIQLSFKNSRKMAGQIYQISRDEPLNPLDITTDDFTRFVHARPGLQLRQTLKKYFSYLSPIVLSEISFRLNMKFTRPNQDYSPAQLDSLLENIRTLLHSCFQDPPRVYLDDGNPFIFSLTELKQYQNLEYEIFENVNQALVYYIFQHQKTETRLKKINAIESLLEKKVHQLDSLLEQLGKLPDEQELRGQYQKYGELLLAQMYDIPARSSEALVIDLFDPGQKQLKISLDPRLTAKENAQSYFQKARNAASQKKKTDQNIRHLSRQKKKLISLQQALTKKVQLKDLLRIEKELIEMHILQTDDQRMEEVYRPYKQYFYKNWEIWVGKNARANDEMTFGLAHKEDLWLHAQGVAGSHVVIRKPHRKQDIPREIIEYAARLAAINSQAKHSSFVPVIYTRVKYVRKPRKSSPGTVIPERSQTIFTESDPAFL